MGDQVTARPPGGRPDHFLCFGHVPRQRFLADDVLTGRGGLQHNRVVQVRGRADVYHVHGVDQRLQLGKDPRTVGQGQRLRLGSRLGSEANDLGAGLRPAGGMGRPHKSRADNTHSHRSVASLFNAIVLCERNLAT